MDIPRTLRILPLLFWTATPFATQESQAPPGTATDTVVISWLRENAIPLRHLEAGRGFDDLQPLEPLLEDVRIVGLGEASHGARELLQLKHRLLEFLVTEMGFTALALEASYSDSKPINDYILEGKGDRASVLTGQGYVVWDTEEFSAMLQVMGHSIRPMPNSERSRLMAENLMFILDRERPEAKIVADDHRGVGEAPRRGMWRGASTSVDAAISGRRRR